MITKQQAEQLVYERINAPNPQCPDKPEMIVTLTEERQSGWLIYWTSRRWHETGDIRYAIAGNGPYLVCREDGTMFETGTARFSERIADAERRLAEYAQSLSPNERNA